MPQHWTLPHTTRQLQFRRLRADDLSAFLAYRSDPQVARFQGWSPMSEAQARDFLNQQAGFTELVPDAWVQLGVAEPDGKTLLGDVGIGLSADASCAEIGVSLARTAQGRGLGTRTVAGLIELIFASTEVAAIEAHTDQRNVPCIGALQRAGMTRTGTRTETWKGEVCTEIRFLATRPA